MKTVERESNDETHIKRVQVTIWRRDALTVTTATATQPVWCKWMPKNKRIYVCIYPMCIAISMSAHNIQEFSARLHGSRKGITNVKREEELPTWCQENCVDDFMDYSCIHGGVSSLKCISLYSVHSTASVLKKSNALQSPQQHGNCIFL